MWENLDFHGRFFGMDAKTAKRPRRPGCSSSSGCPSGPTSPVMALSGGMAQRLMVARAVMHRPSVLFLDEPTAGLDPQSRIALWEILGELHVDGQTILLTTHYMEEADQLCDRVAIIDQGRIVALDTPAGLKRSVGADTTVRVVAEGDLDALAQLLRARSTAPPRRPSCGDAVLLGVQRHRRACCRASSRSPSATASTSPTSRSRRPRLETVFITLTGKDLRE